MKEDKTVGGRKWLGNLKRFKKIGSERDTKIKSWDVKIYTFTLNCPSIDN